METTAKTTAAEYVANREHCWVWWSSVGNPAGCMPLYLHADTDLPFDLTEVAGEVDAEGTFVGTSFDATDFGNSTIHQIQICAEDKWAGERIVACRGAHYGTAPGASCDGLGTPTEPASDAVLRALAEIDLEDLAIVGLRACEDPTDDGTNFAIADQGLYERFCEVAERLDSEYDIDDWGDLDWTQEMKGDE